MDWKQILGGIAPTLGGVLAAAGGPVGMVAGAALQAVSRAVLNKPDGTETEVAQAIQSGLPPDAVVSLQKADNDFHLAMEQQFTAQQAQAVQNAADVNVSLQAEAKADHWPTYSWRPWIGFCFGTNLILSTVLVIGVFAAQVFSASGADKAIAALPSTLGALAAISGLATPILGIASWFRGKMQSDPNINTDNRG